MSNAKRTFLLLLLVLSYCMSCSSGKHPTGGNDLILSVFHAGSLAVPMKNLATAFQKENPGVTLQLEAAGSLASVRKITELDQQCDVLALADYILIDELMIPDYADWNILFATNELGIAYSDNSRRSAEIRSDNWFDVLSDPEVRYGRSDPDSDPCGYRTVLALKLTALLAKNGMDWEGFLKKDLRFVRGKETDLIALLESQTIDYMFNYRSVAIQHGFEFLALPDSANLSKPQLADWYDTVQLEVRGASPGSVIIQRGAPIVYGMTIPFHAPNPELAYRFIRFIADSLKGRPILEQCGQTPIFPRYSDRTRTTKVSI